MSTRAQLAVFCALSIVGTATGLLGARSCAVAPTGVTPGQTQATPPSPRAPAPMPALVDAARESAPDAAEGLDDGFLERHVAAQLVPLTPLTQRAREPARNEPVGASEPAALAGPAALVLDPVNAGSATAAMDAALPQTANAKAIVAPELLSAPLVIVFRDQLTWLKRVELRLFIDGQRVVDERGARDPGERTLLQTRLFPGHHRVELEAVYVDGGVFAYMKAYRVTLRDAIVVDVRKNARVVAATFDRGALEQWQKRPGLKLSAQ